MVIPSTFCHHFKYLLYFLQKLTFVIYIYSVALLFSVFRGGRRDVFLKLMKNCGGHRTQPCVFHVLLNGVDDPLRTSSHNLGYEANKLNSSDNNYNEDSLGMIRTV